MSAILTKSLRKVNMKSMRVKSRANLIMRKRLRKKGRKELAL